MGNYNYRKELLHKFIEEIALDCEEKERIVTLVKDIEMYGGGGTTTIERNCYISLLKK